MSQESLETTGAWRLYCWSHTPTIRKVLEKEFEKQRLASGTKYLAECLHYIDFSVVLFSSLTSRSLSGWWVSNHHHHPLRLHTHSLEQISARIFVPVIPTTKSTATWRDRADYSSSGGFIQNPTCLKVKGLWVWRGRATNKIRIQQ